MNNLVKFPTSPVAIDKAITVGDLSALTSVERVHYYLAACESLNLNPVTKPFDYIKEQGKISLYVNSGGCAQLRDNRQVSLKILSREVIDGVYIVTAQGSTPDGRTDEATGAIALAGLEPKAKANAMMKAETKAKRRVTLSICGLGWMQDEDSGQAVKAEIYDPPQDVVNLPPPPRQVTSVAIEVREEDFGKRIAHTNKIAKLSGEQIAEIASKVLGRPLASSKDIQTTEECLAICEAMLNAEPGF